MGLIRTLLALAVMLGHAGYSSRGFLNPGLAVQCFYIISGFYMSLILTDKYRANTLFYSNRLLRLFPSYFVALAATLAFVFAGNALLGFDWSGQISAPSFGAMIALLGANLVILGQDILCWFDVAPSGDLALVGTVPDATPAWRFMLIPQAWSISLELMFYAMAPFLALLRTRWLIAIAVASVAVRTMDVGMGYWLWPRRLFPGELCLFLFGMISFRAMRAMPDDISKFGIPALVCLIGLLLAHPHLPVNEQVTWALLYAAVAIALPFLFLRFKSSAADRRIGDLSYPIYLVHILAISIVDALQVEWRLAAIFCVTILASVALYYAVELPIESVRRARASKHAEGEAAAKVAAAA